MRDVDKALIDIANIRNQLAAGTVFQGFGPAVILATGALAVIVAGLQFFWPHRFASGDIGFLTVWIVVAIIAATLIGVEMIARSRRHHGGLADAMLANAIEQFLPAGFAGAGITAVLMKFSPESLWMLPGLWQVFIALGIFAAVKSLPRSIALVGAWYFLAGICTLIIASMASGLSPLMMGLPFAIGQFLMAGLLYIASQDGHDEQQ